MLGFRQRRPGLKWGKTVFPAIFRHRPEHKLKDYLYG